MKPFSESCEQNKQPILEILSKELAHVEQVLEIGSGTGQHAVFFAAELPHLDWQTSDVAEYHPGILAWQADSGLSNVRAPLRLHVTEDRWPETQYDAVFSANTVHIMGWPEVEAMFTGIGSILRPGGRFCLYGPFNYGGRFTSDSNARFDQWLKTRDSRSGVRNFEDLDQLARAAGMRLVQDYAMPANNRLLVWVKNP